MGTDREETAALNNAAWCAAVCRAHGRPVAQASGLWFCRGPTPRFYPNAVSVARAADPAEQAAFIADLRRRDPDPDFSVKDSFAALDLSAAGLTPLFEARWLWRDPGAGGAIDQDRWRRVRDPRTLGDWETAWRGGDPVGPRIFRPELLSDDRIAVIGEFGPAGVIESGGIACAAAGVAGVGNLFGQRGAAIEALAALFPTLPLAGYEAGDALRAAADEGFAVLGPLRVWAERS